MADENADKAEEMGSAAKLMIEALDKASTELDGSVTSSVQQLAAFNEALEKSLSIRLNKLTEKVMNAVELGVEDLTIRKEEFAGRLFDLESAEIESVSVATREVKEQLAKSAQQSIDAVSQLIDEQMSRLRSLTENPQGQLAEFSQSEIDKIASLIQSSSENIETQEGDLEKRVSNCMQSFDNNIQGVVAAGKQKLEEKLEVYHQDFESKIADVMDRLSKLVTTTIQELENKSSSGGKIVLDFTEEMQKKLAKQMDNWQADLLSINGEYQATLAKDKKTSEELHAIKLKHKVAEVKDEINKIANEASAKLNSSHKLFYSSLKRLEKKYYDRLERLFARFETALSQESRLTTGANAYRPQSSHELREILRARLQARGVEIVKEFRRQVEQFDAEYSRTAQGSHERIETIRATTIDLLEKQVRSMSMEVGRIVRSFRNELTQFESQTPQVDEAGRTAALAVKAYRNAVLSFGSD